MIYSCVDLADPKGFDLTFASYFLQDTGEWDYDEAVMGDTEGVTVLGEEEWPFEAGGDSSAPPYNIVQLPPAYRKGVWSALRGIRARLGAPIPCSIIPPHWLLKLLKEEDS